MHERERERTNIVSECLSSGCKNLESNSLLVVFRRIINETLEREPS